MVLWLTFLYTRPYEHVQYNVSGPQVMYFCLKQVFRKKIFTIVFVVKSLMGFGWNNVGPASQTVANHYICIGPMFRVIWCFWRRDGKRHITA